MYTVKNPKKYYREYREKNKEKIRAYQKSWIENNKDRIREKYRDSKQFRRIEQRKDLLESVGKTKCNKCGFSDWRGLQIDHINGSGVAEKKTGVSDTIKRYKCHIMKNKEKYQVLCANCNWIKRYERNETTFNRTKEAK